MATDEAVPHAERPVFQKNGRHGSLAGVQRAFDNAPRPQAVAVRLDVEQFGLQQNLVEQIVHSLPHLGRDWGPHCIAAELLEQHLVLQQLLLYLLHLGRRQVHLVDGNNQGDARILRVADRLHRLWHHPVVCRHH